jgi:hypothetical protein
LPALDARAQSLTPDEQAFFDRHASDLVKVEPARLSDPAVAAVFSVPLYTVTVSLFAQGGTSTSSFVATRFGGRLVSVDTPGTDDAAPMIAKFLNPSFRLRTDQDATILARALDLAYPIVADAERKAATFRRSGTHWQFIRNHFFGSPSGFTFTTDRAGAITAVTYALKLPAT